MGRPSDWSPLAASDPVPGDPYEVQMLAGDLRSSAQKISGQVDALRKLCTDEFWDSDAGKVFRDKANDTASHLEKAFARYQQASAALEAYHPELTDAQSLSLQALEDAKDADRRDRAATTALDGKPADDPNHATLTNQQSTARTDLDAARSKLRRAQDMRDQAAHRAANAINTVITSDGLKDSAWDKFKHWVDDNAGWISRIADVAGWIATIFGVLALVVNCIPVIGQALSAVFGAIALVATIVALVAHIVLALAGDGSWFDVAMDAIALATFGVGRVAVTGSRVAATGARALARNARVEEVLAAKLATTGRAMTGKTMKALSKAARREVATEFPGLSARGVERALADAPKGLWPGWGRVTEGFRPSSIWHETVDSAKAVKDGAGEALRTIKADGLNFRALDPLPSEASNAISDLKVIGPNLLRNPTVAPLANAASNMRLTFYGSTAAATGLDWLNHTPLVNPLKNLTTVK